MCWWQYLSSTNTWASGGETSVINFTVTAKWVNAKRSLLRPLECSFQKYAARSSFTSHWRQSPNKAKSAQQQCSSFPYIWSNHSAFSIIFPLLILGQRHAGLNVCVAVCNDITRGTEGKEVGRRKCLEWERRQRHILLITQQNIPASEKGQMLAWLSFTTISFFLCVPLSALHYSTCIKSRVTFTSKEKRSSSPMLYRTIFYILNGGLWHQIQQEITK